MPGLLKNSATSKSTVQHPEELRFFSDVRIWEIYMDTVLALIVCFRTRKRLANIAINQALHRA